jgi:predicted lipoprotein with Yx(FWY)xxD motif
MTLKRNDHKGTARPRPTLMTFGIGLLAAIVLPGGIAFASGGGGGSTAISVQHTTLGSVITSKSGLTLYLFEADKRNVSTCSGDCATVWHPLIAHGHPKATGAAKTSLLGTIKRSGGSRQVTYAGHALYTYVGDTHPGSVSGEGQQSFGAGWDALTPNGKKIEAGS